MLIVSGCPCKDCSDRVLKCHDTCEKYKAWVAIADEKKAALKAIKSDEMANYVHNRNEAYREKKRKRGR